VDILTAEVVKTFENTYRDVEIAIANDFAKYCDHLGVDFFTIRNIVNAVEARNLHLPGGGVGGHCIPKDTWLLAYGARGKYTPDLLLKAREVNDSMPQYVSERIFSHLDDLPGEISTMKVGILGLSYLAESDDTRNSPTVDLVNILDSKGVNVSVHDHIVKGEQEIEYSSELSTVISGSDVLVVMVAHSLYSKITPDEISSMMRGKLVIDTRNVMKVSDYQHSNTKLFSLGRGH
jgi:UDP-N-acetyl-D-mannosaminuronic acid dehydrogenase